jgi:hypothetical protein
MKKLSQAWVEKLRQRHPQLNFISERISNNALLQLRPESAFTMYGTAAHEMALSGVPVVTCGDHPHIGFDFNHHAKTRQQLKALIQRADRLRMRISKNRYVNICSRITFSSCAMGCLLRILPRNRPIPHREVRPLLFWIKS